MGLGRTPLRGGDHPELGLTGYSNQDLFHQDALLHAALDALGAVRDASVDLRPVLVAGLPLRVGHQLFNVAVVVPADPQAPPTLDELCAHLRSGGLNPRKLPVQLEFVDELPRNAMGKVMKKELKAQFLP